MTKYLLLILILPLLNSCMSLSDVRRVDVLMNRMDTDVYNNKQKIIDYMHDMDYKAYDNFNIYLSEQANPEQIIQGLATQFHLSVNDAKSAINSGKGLFEYEMLVYHAPVLGRHTAYFLFFDDNENYKGHFFLR